MAHVVWGVKTHAQPWATGEPPNETATPSLVPSLGWFLFINVPSPSLTSPCDHPITWVLSQRTLGNRSHGGCGGLGFSGSRVSIRDLETPSITDSGISGTSYMCMLYTQLPIALRIFAASCLVIVSSLNYAMLNSTETDVLSR